MNWKDFIIQKIVFKGLGAFITSVKLKRLIWVVFCTKN